MAKRKVDVREAVLAIHRVAKEGTKSSEISAILNQLGIKVKASSVLSYRSHETMRTKKQGE